MDKRFFVLFILYCGLIYYLSSIPNLTLKNVFNFQDLFLHFGEYSVFALLLYFSFPHDNIPSLLIFTQIFAFLDELHQFFVPGRTFSILDFFADFLGAFFCLIAIIKCREIFKGERDKKFKGFTA